MRNDASVNEPPNTVPLTLIRVLKKALSSLNKEKALQVSRGVVNCGEAWGVSLKAVLWDRSVSAVNTCNGYP
jgi:hypothetical protein